MSDTYEGDPVTVNGRPETDWRFYRGHGPHVAEVYRVTGQGHTIFKIVKADDVIFKKKSGTV